MIKNHRKLSIVLTVLACYVGVGLISWLVLIHQSLRLDESQSLWQTSHSIGGTLKAVAEDVHVPLYHMMLHFWQLYLGHGVATIRLMSLLIFLISVPLVYLLARQILSTGWSLFAMAIFSFTPFMDWYANEARMYTLLALFATLSQFYFLQIMKRRRGGWWGYTITAVVGAYSHYFFSFNLAAQGVFYLLRRKTFAPGSFKRFVMVAILVIAALAPWLIYFHSLGSGKNTTPQLDRPSSVDFFNVFSQFMFGFQDDRINTILVSCWPLVVLAAFFAIRKGQKISEEVGYMVTAALLPVIMAYALSYVVNPFFLSRYMISCVAPLIIVAVWLVSHYPRRLAAVASALIIAVVIFGSIQQDASSQTPVKEDYRGAAQAIEKESSSSDVIVLSAPFTVYPFEYYYNGDLQINTLPTWDRESPGAIPAFNAKTLPSEVNQINVGHNYVYLVLSQDQGYENTIKQYYLHHFKEVSHHTYSPDLTLYVFQVGYNKVPALGSPQTIISQ